MEIESYSGKGSRPFISLYYEYTRILSIKIFRTVSDKFGIGYSYMLYYREISLFCQLVR